MKLLVFGAGFSSLAAIRSIRRRFPGAQIAATTRDVGKMAQLSALGLTAHVFDGTPDAGLQSAIAAASHVLVSAAPNGAGDPVLNACAAHLAGATDLEWIGYYSTVGVYGDADGQWIDESYPTQVLNSRIAWRLGAEAAWAELARARGLPLAVLRLAGIYGPGRSAFDKLRSGKARRIIKPGQVFNRIHNEDIGEITARAFAKRLAGIFNIADDEPAPPQDVIAHAAALLGVEPPPEMPFAQADMTPMARSFYAGNRRVRNDRIKSALGYRMLYPSYREGLRAILDQERGD